jgi:hypothetical protein
MIVEISDPHIAESVAMFTLSDGSSFRLHATDLGAWIEETVPVGTSYRSLHDLLTDYYHHQYALGSPLAEPIVTVEGDLLELQGEGRSFKGTISSFASEDQKLVRHTKGPALLAACATMGNLWAIFLNHNEYPDLCPPELSRSPKGQP